VPSQESCSLANFQYNLDHMSPNVKIRYEKKMNILGTCDPYTTPDDVYIALKLAESLTLPVVLRIRLLNRGYASQSIPGCNQDSYVMANHGSYRYHDSI